MFIIKPTYSIVPQCNNIQEQIDRQVAEYLGIIRDLHTRRNTQSPIFRLPMELIAKIFVIAKADLRESSQFRIAGCAELWSSIDISFPDHARYMLERSKGSLLKIGGLSCPIDVKRHGSIAKSIMSEVGRIREISLSASTTREIEQIVCLNLGAPASALEILVLRRRGFDIPIMSPSLSQDIFSRDMCALHTLHLTRFSLSSSLPTFPQLVGLTLTSRHGALTPLPIILTSLSHNPHIERLTLCTAISGSVAIAPATLVLPKLNALTFTVSEIGDGSDFFKYIAFPTTAMVTFGCDDVPPTVPDFSILKRVVSRLCDASTPAIAEVEINVCQRELFGLCIILTGKALLKLSVAMNTSVAQSLVQRMVGVLTSLHLDTVTRLILQGCGNILSQADWSPLIRKFGALHELEAAEVGNQFFLALLKEDSEEKVLLPNLGRMLLEECILERRAHGGSIGALKTFLQERNALGARLNFLKIENCTLAQESVRQLEEYTNVIWDMYTRPPTSDVSD